jgi:hypothetical protein
LSDTPPFVVPDTITEIAQTILTVCGGALDDNAIRGYSTRIINIGADLAVMTPGTLAVIFKQMHSGKIGTPQFAGLVPGEAKWADHVALFTVELWTPPGLPELSISSVAGARQNSVGQINAFAATILGAGYVIFAAMQQGQYQNALFPFKPALVGPLVPLGPKGDTTGMELSVQVQLP